MRPSLPVLLPLLLATFLAIAHADSTASAPAPSLEEATLSPPRSWAPVPPPPPPPPSSTPVYPPLPPPAAWTPVADVKDKTIQQVGNFAVRIYTLTWYVELVFVDVISGNTQPCDGGYNYQLVVAVDSPDAKSAQYEAAVWGIMGTTSWELRSFVPK